MKRNNKTYNKYLKYNVEDFLNDNFFILSILTPDSKSQSYWNTFLFFYPNKKPVIDKARHILESITWEHDQSFFTKKEINNLYKEIQSEQHCNHVKLRKKTTQILIFASAAIIALLIVSSFFISSFLKENTTEFEYKETNIYTQRNTHKSKLKQNKLVLRIGNNDYNFCNNTHIKVDKTGIYANNKGKEKKIISNSLLSDHFLHLYIPYKMRGSIQLEDNSTLQVNSGSILTFPSKFSSKQREIYLDGEAYASITKDAERRFLIHTNDLNIHVYGTSFNIYSYSSSNEAHIALISGAVKVSTKNDNTLYNINPNQLFHKRKDKNSIEIKDITANDYIKWKDGYIVFSDEKLKYVLERLSFYYGLNIKCDNTALLDKNISGKLVLFNDLISTLDALSHILSFSFNIDNNYIIIK